VAENRKKNFEVRWSASVQVVIQNFNGDRSLMARQGESFVDGVQGKQQAALD